MRRSAAAGAAAHHWYRLDMPGPGCEHPAPGSGGPSYYRIQHGTAREDGEPKGLSPFPEFPPLGICQWSLLEDNGSTSSRG